MENMPQTSKRMKYYIQPLIRYYVSKKQLPILYSNFLNKMGNYFLDTQYIVLYMYKLK